MMKISIFNYLDYRFYIKDLIKSQPAAGRGERKRLSLAIQCQMAFITHVLTGEKDFSHEQLLKISKHFNLSEAERDYLFDLLSYSRAGSKDLSEIFLKRLQTRREEQNMLQIRLKEQSSLTAQDQVEYYSHWIYSAVHMASTIPALQTVSALAKHFGMSGASLQPVLEFLSATGLIQIEGGQVASGQAHVFVGRNSPLVIQHHKNLRVKVMHDLSSQKEDDIHYSLCFSASAKDWPILREKILHAIDDCLATIRPSKEEKLGIFCLDFQEI